MPHIEMDNFSRTLWSSDLYSRGGGGDSHMEQTGMILEILNLTRKGDHLGVAQAFCDS